MKDSKSLLLGLVSLLLAGTWIFHIYDKSKYARVQENNVVVDSVALKKALSDSIKQIYQSTISQIDNVQTEPASDSLSTQLNQKLREIDTLRMEINQMLSVNTLTREDLGKALKKIQQLQKQLEAVNGNSGVSNRNSTVAASPTAEVNPTVTAPAQNLQSKPASSSSIANADFLTVNDIRFQAMEKTEQANDQSTNKAMRAEYFALSFALRNNSNSFPGSQVFVVIKSPTGQVIQDDEWLAGIFNSRNEGAVRYSRKLSVDYNRGDVKRLNTTVSIPKIEAGTYQLLIYHNGYRVGKSDLVLN